MPKDGINDDGSGLLAALGRSRELGLLGPGDVAAHVEHARGFVRLLDRFVPPSSINSAPEQARVVDLGSGGGLPGLVIAVDRPDLELVLVDASERRTAVLRDAVRRLGVTVSVLTGRAETLSRSADLRERIDVVVARSFGPPSVVAECAVAFLRPGGLMIVSEPSDAPARWPSDPLAELGLEVVERVDHPRLIVLRRTDRPLDPAVPRRDGVPARRPRF